MAAQSIAIRYRHWVAAVLFAFAGLAAALLVYSDKKTIAAAIAFLFFTLVSVFAARFTIRPLLLITKEGIHYKSRHFFPWHEITDIREARIGDGLRSSIRIELRDKNTSREHEASTLQQAHNSHFRISERVFKPSVIDEIFDTDLTLHSTIAIKPYHSTENLSRKELARQLKAMQRDYFIRAYQNGVMFLSEFGREQFESAQDMLALTEQAFRDGVIGMNEYVRAKADHAQHARMLIELWLPDHLKGIYRIE